MRLEPDGDESRLPSPRNRFNLPISRFGFLGDCNPLLYATREPHVDGVSVSADTLLEGSEHADQIR